VSISSNTTTVVSGSSLTFTPKPINGGSNPSYSWFVNGILVANNTGPFLLSGITAPVSVYCKMTSNLSCSKTQVSSNPISVNLLPSGFEYASSRFYQYTGNVLPGAKNQPVIYGKLDGMVSANPGKWGVSGLSFLLSNSNNDNVLAAKLYYNTSNDFSTAVLNLTYSESVKFSEY
jgi:hypothetical protein